MQFAAHFSTIPISVKTGRTGSAIHAEQNSAGKFEPDRHRQSDRNGWKNDTEELTTHILCNKGYKYTPMPAQTIPYNISSNCNLYVFINSCLLPILALCLLKVSSATVCIGIDFHNLVLTLHGGEL
jgi:hypothetical protein